MTFTIWFVTRMDIFSIFIAPLKALFTTFHLFYYHTVHIFLCIHRGLNNTTIKLFKNLTGLFVFS